MNRNRNRKMDRDRNVIGPDAVKWLLPFGLLVGMFVLPSAHSVPADFYLMEVSPKIIEPGETAILNVTLKNLAPNYAGYLRASVDPDDVSPIDVVGIPRKYINTAEKAEGSNEFFGVIQGEDIHLSMPINVKKDTADGVYRVPLVLKWNNELLEDVTQTLYMGIQIRGEPLLKVAKVTTSPVELKPDMENGEVTITMENAGKATAKSVRVKIALEKPFFEAYSNSNSDFVAEIARDKTHDFTLGVDVDEKVEAGSYAFPLTVTYRSDDREYSIKEEVVLAVESEADFEVGEVKTNPELIKPGDDFKINVLMVNTGQKDAESVKAVLKTKSYFTGVKTDYLGNVKAGESKLATFDLTADRDTIPDNYENDIKIIWSEGDKRLDEIESIGITVSSGQDEGGSPGKTAGGLAVLAGIVGLVMWRKRR